MIEACADVSDAVMEKFVAGDLGKVTEAEIWAALRKGGLEFKFVPVTCGSAFKNKGVQMLLDAVVSLLPSPLDIPAVSGVHPRRKRRTGRRRSRRARPPTMRLSPRSRSRS